MSVLLNKVALLARVSSACARFLTRAQYNQSPITNHKQPTTMNSKKELEDTITTKLYESRLQAKAFFNDKYQETVKPYKDLIAVVMKANNIKELPALIKIQNNSEFFKTNAMAQLMFVAATVELIEENYQNHQSPITNH